MGKDPLNFLILVVPPEGRPRTRIIKATVDGLDSVIENSKARFDYYHDLIIATNDDHCKLPRNEHIKDLEVWGTCYFIGNQDNDDFKALKTGEINKLLSMMFSP